jgi:hypothetical protein
MFNEVAVSVQRSCNLQMSELRDEISSNADSIETVSTTSPQTANTSEISLELSLEYQVSEIKKHLRLLRQASATIHNMVVIVDNRKKYLLDNNLPEKERQYLVNTLSDAIKGILPLPPRIDVSICAILTTLDAITTDLARL